MKFEEVLKEKTRDVEATIRSYLPKGEGNPNRLIEAMNYAMTAGGKRLRPILMQESYRLFQGDRRIVEPFMAAIEMIHTHSLIHDDLPALDDDLYRRGKKTTHAEFGEALGILSGDALLNYAYETALCAFEMGYHPERVGQAMEILSQKTGIYGMLGGQSVDVMNDGRELDQETLDYIYKHKTAALIEAPLMVGAVLAGATMTEVSVMEQIGEKIGLAFQIQDDILDVTGSQEELGKPVFSDQKNHKTTYVTLQGLEQARQTVRNLTEEAEDLLNQLPYENSFLRDLLHYLAARRR